MDNTNNITDNDFTRKPAKLRKPAPFTYEPSSKGNSPADDLIRKLEFELNFDPIDELVKLYRSKQTGPNEKMRIAMELAQYRHAKRKALEVKDDKGELVNINVMFPEGVKVSETKMSTVDTALMAEAA